MQVLLKMARRGFVGPRYEGILGKARFVMEATVGRRELLLANTRDSFQAADPPPDLELTLHRIARFDDLSPFVKDLEAAYHPGYVDRWRAQFGWGEQGVVGTIQGRVVCFDWLQYGTRRGFPTYWGRLMDGECRFLRAGVLPSFRRRGVNSLMKHRLLRRVFEEEGIERVYAEVHTNNIPSLKALLGVGFQAIGLMTVVEAPPFGGFVRWSGIESIDAELLAYGVDLKTRAMVPA